MYPFRKSVPLQEKCTPSGKVYPLQEKCTPSGKVYPLQEKCTPSGKVYPFRKSVPPAGKVYPFRKSVPPAGKVYQEKCTPCRKSVPPAGKVYPLQEKCTPCRKSVPHFRPYKQNYWFLILSNPLKSIRHQVDFDINFDTPPTATPTSLLPLRVTSLLPLAPLLKSAVGPGAGVGVAMCVSKQLQ